MFLGAAAAFLLISMIESGQASKRLGTVSSGNSASVQNTVIA